VVYLCSVGLETIILDEVHYIKNIKAQRTKAVFGVSENVPKIIGLSGTPIDNKPVEIFNAIHLMRPDVYLNVFHFGIKYCKRYNPYTQRKYGIKKSVDSNG